MGWNDGLDDVPWAKAYRPARDVPAMVRALVEGPSDGRQAVVDGLWNILVHQGTLAPVAAEVIPWLAAYLVEGPPQPDG